MPKFDRRLATVEAVQWSPANPIEGVKLTAPERGSLTARGILKTPLGTFFVQHGDWVVTDGFGNRWVVEFGRFKELYAPHVESTGSDPGDDPDYAGY
jgi:hypothetical protein